MENYNRVEKYENVTFYYLNNTFHRIDGPAMEYANGDKVWWQNGKLHRLDGPTIECVNGDKYWYYEGKYIKCNSQEEFEKYLKLKLFW